MNDWKDRLGVVFSTNPDYNYQHDEPEDYPTLPTSSQRLRISIEKKGRGGKVVTVVKGFVGSQEDIRKLEKMLKQKCGVGGSSKDGEIMLQGNLKDKTIAILKDAGYKDTK